MARVDSVVFLSMFLVFRIILMKWFHFLIV